MSLANHVPLSPLTFLARARRAFPGKIAVVDGDGTEVSYETLGRDCAAMAGALRAGGIRPAGVRGYRFAGAPGGMTPGEPVGTPPGTRER